MPPRGSLSILMDQASPQGEYREGLLNEELTFKTRIRAYQSRNASACQAPSSAYKRGRARPEMVKHALTNGGYFQTLSFVCITYYYTHTEINDFMSMRRNRLDQVAGGIFLG